ncbi:MAG: hypothetical protein PW789_07015 [Edaphobacter sp.]|uniref:hypothetical protein n=1 Tax=Edaphobacter sp. TaxID=1934404 RepID=UPI002391A887|nr:hypothetical protein [Edaphobacter sp.]MDE1176345.1 hypothetical protein [Edaphobacter sp.]
MNRDNLYRMEVPSTMPSHAFAPRNQNWNVEQGEAQDIAHGLEKSEAQALVFVSHARPDDERTKALFGFLRRASEVADVMIEKKQQSSWDAIIEALTPAVPLTSNRVVEAKMLAQAMTKVVESEDFARAADIAEIGHFSSKNPSSQPNRWKNSGLIFAIPYKGVDLYPLYALELQGGAKPLPVMEKILGVLQDKDDWQKAFWFASPNSYLKSKAPKDLLKSKPQDVLRAAETEASGVQHG